MSGRRTPPSELKLLSGPAKYREAQATETHQAVVGGLGLDFDDVPELLDDRGRAEWERLAKVYADQPVRFREGDRAAMTAYCAYWSAFAEAAADVAKRGVIVRGRSQKDMNRKVKNPATVVQREAATQLRYWARELGLTPDARGRIGVDETTPEMQSHAARLLDPDHTRSPFA